MAATYSEQFVEAPADDNAVELLKKLQAQTVPASGNATRPPIYNAPDRWYAKPDGDIVKLQGDAASQAYYVSKGFHLLTPAETQEWLGGPPSQEKALLAAGKGVRGLVVAEQRKRATLITTLRRIALKHPGVDIAGDLDVTPTEELEGMLEQIKRMTGGNVAVVMGRFRDDTPAVDLSGVELSGGAELERKLEAAQANAAGAAARPRSASGKFQGSGADA
jgi:hypothetical protein